MSKLIVRVTSGLKQSRLLEAFANYIDRNEYDQHFVFLNEEPPDLAKKFEDRGFQTHWVQYRSRKDTPKAVWQLKKYFSKHRPDIVHTHLVDASIAGLTAAKLAGVPGRLHTRHHGTECHQYYPRGVYYDKYINRMSQKIMATSNVVRDILVDWEKVPSEKVAVINHGFDFADFATDPARVEELRRKYGLERNSPIIGVVSRFVEWKGVQHIIPAFAELKKEYKNAKLVLANAQGSYEPEIDRLLDQQLSPSDYVKIPFEKHIFDLYRLFDVFVHVPIGKHYEALGQTYIEPLYTGVPSVFTMAGIANDFIRHERNALVVAFEDSHSILLAIKRVLTDKQLREKLRLAGRDEIIKRFSGERLGSDLVRLYQDLLQ